MTSTLVIGGGIAGLVAARAAVLRGHSVTLLESNSVLGGNVGFETLDGLKVDVGAESFASRGSAVASLAGALDLELVPPAPGGAWLQLTDRAVPLPAAGVLGIPGSPLADDVRAAIGTRGALRAWADRVIPELHIGREVNLGRLVRRRMGSAVLDTLVRPVVEGVYGLDPDNAEVDALVPGLNGLLTQTGSLSSAVLSMRASSPAGAAVTGIRGGIHLLVDRLEAELVRLGVSISAGHGVDAIERRGDGWAALGEWGEAVADRLIVAASGAAARELLAPHVGAELFEGWPEARISTAVVLLVDAPSLDAAPRGTGVLVADAQQGHASALTHSSAKWPWLGDLLPGGRHVLRLTYRQTASAVSVDRALDDAAALLGVSTNTMTLIDSAKRQWTQDAARGSIGLRGRIAAVSETVTQIESLDVVGSWLAGTGLASVVPQAQGVAAH